jgi:hypothetical protein
MFIEEKISLANHIPDHGLTSYNIQICSLDEMIAIYAKQPNAVLFALGNQYLDKTLITLPIDNIDKVVDIHCPTLHSSRENKKSYFQVITELKNNRRQIWNYYSTDGSQASKKLHSIVNTS